MSEASWTSRTLFTQAIALPASEQTDFIAQCNASEEIKSEVLRLLQFHRVEDEDFLEPSAPEEWGQGFRSVGDYAIESRIAAGGMGVVFLGRDTRLNRRVAIKVLPPYLNDLTDARNRLIHEAKVAAKLEHPGIVPVYDIVITDSVVAVVSQFIDGQTLDSWMKAGGSRGEGGSESSVQLMRSVAEALGHAHRAGVVHRDLKPSNILIDAQSGQPKITDFGIAKVLTQTEVLHTSAGSGTCYYMSPEQTRESSDGLGPESDIFSLGIVLFQMLTGTRPFDGPTRESIVDAIRSGNLTAPRQLDSSIARDLELILLKMLEVEPGYRYRSCEELVQDLDRYLEGRPVLASPPSLGRRARELVLSRRQMLIRTGMLAAGLTGGSYVASRLLDNRALLQVTTGSASAGISVYRWIPTEYRHVLVGKRDRRGSTIRLDDGMYRVRVQYPTGFREFDRFLGEDPVSIESSPPQGTDDVARMVRVSLPDSGWDQSSAPEDYLDLIRHVQPFYIDLHEVSCSEYRAFVLATGHPPPPLWPDPYDAAWDELPVTMVSGEDATAYAEWCGKRLPTYPEWQLMARGPYADPYPWGGELPNWGAFENPRDRSASYGNWGQNDLRPKMTVRASEEVRVYFLKNAWPVTQRSRDERSADSSALQQDGNSGIIRNLLGNVSEWTSTPFARLDASGELTIDYSDRFICGQPWAEPGGDIKALDLAGWAADSVDQATLGRGFRCARSIIE